MSKSIIRIVIVSILTPGILGLMSWNLTQASKNKEKIIFIHNEHKILLLALGRIEQGIKEIKQDQKIFNVDMAKMSIAQAITNQKLTDHVTVSGKRIELLRDSVHKHLYR